MSKKRYASQVIHASKHQGDRCDPINQGPVFASTFHLRGDPTPNQTFQYGRFNNPTWLQLEASIGALEGGECIIFPSGMAAISSILCSLCQSGDAIILPSDGYDPSRQFVERFLSKFGVRLLCLPTLDIVKADLQGIKLVLLESPSNPLLDIIDIKAFAEKARQHDTLLAIDNTTATPLGQQPLSLGADISLASDSKALNGHSDVIFGHVAAKNPIIINSIKEWRKLSGAIPGPMETFLVQRGLASLDMRLERMTHNAMILAEFLLQHSAVNWLRYPGLPQDPAHTLAKKQMQHFGFIITFDLGSKQQAEAFLARCELISEATSFGGLHSMAERRARWQPSNLGPGVIRLSVGCEHEQDLLADLQQALGPLN